MIRVFSLTTGADTAGIGYGLHAAFTRFGRDISVRTMVASQNYIGYPVDIPWAKLALQQEWDHADVIQIHNTLHAHRWYDITGKPTVLMHHGLGEGAPFHEIVAEARGLGIVQIGSTLDLSVHEPDVVWSPPPIDISDMQIIRERHYRPASRLRMRIGHAPTNQAIKGTAAFLAAMETLEKKYPVEAVLISGMLHKECLAIKATCDILFDQPVLGYGVNAIEAWAMGMPVIAGVADLRVREHMIATWGRLPFIEASEETLADVLERTINDAFLTSEMAAVGHAHVNRWHSQKAVVASLAGIYRAAGATIPGDGERRLTPRQIRKVARLSPEMQLRA